MSHVAVVTDSTAYLPADVAAAHRLTVVPLHVALGGRSLAEGVEVTSTEVAQALIRHDPVTTSRATPTEFAQVYERLAEQGATAVVSVHLSGELSGTVDAARLAARDVADRVTVEVADSRSIGLGLGFAALAAVAAVDRGADAAAAALAARRTGLGAPIWLYVDSLDYLRRGGRISGTTALVGSALSVKPILHLVDGRIEPYERVRTTSKALARLEELVVEEVGERPVDLGVQHLAAAEGAHELAERLQARLPGVRSLHVAEVGAVIGAHVGPGMIGVVAAEPSA